MPWAASRSSSQASAPPCARLRPSPWSRSSKRRAAPARRTGALAARLRMGSSKK